MKIKPMFCVYLHGNAVHTNYDLTYCLRYIARQLGKRLAFVTVGEAMAAGFEIKRI